MINSPTNTSNIPLVDITHESDTENTDSIGGLGLLSRWKNQYYLSYDGIFPEGSLQEKMHLIELAIIKWKGVRKEVLDEFNEVQGRNYPTTLVFKSVHSALALVEIDVVGNHIDWFCFDSGTCSLCIQYLDEFGCSVECDLCPIKEYTGQDCTELYCVSEVNEDPKYMIDLLEGTLNFIKKWHNV